MIAARVREDPSPNLSRVEFRNKGTKEKYRRRKKKNIFILKWAKFGPFGPLLHLTHSSITTYTQKLEYIMAIFLFL